MFETLGHRAVMLLAELVQNFLTSTNKASLVHNEANLKGMRRPSFLNLCFIDADRICTFQHDITSIIVLV